MKEFHPEIPPGDARYIPPGRNLTTFDGTVEGDCSATCAGFACTRDAGHPGPHVAHGWEDGQAPMYAQWDKEGEKDDPAIRERFADLIRRVLRGDQEAVTALRAEYGGQGWMPDAVIEAVVETGAELAENKQEKTR